jgi:hypothetical protein
MQFNKRDLPNLASVEEMNTLINRHNAPFYEAVATTGIGVEDTLKAVTKLVLNHLAVKYQLGASGPEKAEREDVFAQKPVVSPVERVPEVSAYATGNPAEEDVSLASDSGADFGGMDARENAGGLRDLSPSYQGKNQSQSIKDDLEILDLEDELGMDPAPTPMSISATSAIPAPDDLSALLEEIPEDGPEEVLEVLEEVPPEPAAVVHTSSPMPPLGAGPKRPASIAPPDNPVETRRPGAYPPIPADSSARDPLGIMAARHAEAPESPTIQIGAVTPGKQHQITVPLEMSVEGRRVRLQLRMTLTLSN